MGESSFGKGNDCLCNNTMNGIQNAKAVSTYSTLSAGTEKDSNVRSISNKNNTIQNDDMSPPAVNVPPILKDIPLLMKDISEECKDGKNDLNSCKKENVHNAKNSDIDNSKGKYKPPIIAVEHNHVFPNSDDGNESMIKLNEEDTKHDNISSNSNSNSNSDVITAEEKKEKILSKDGSMYESENNSKIANSENKEVNATVPLVPHQCNACRGRMVVHICGKRSLPIDFDAIAKAEKVKAEKEEEEKRKFRAEKRRLADAKRRDAKKKKKEKKKKKKKEKKKKKKKKKKKNKKRKKKKKKNEKKEKRREEKRREEKRREDP